MAAAHRPGRRRGAARRVTSRSANQGDDEARLTAEGVARLGGGGRHGETDAQASQPDHPRAARRGGEGVHGDGPDAVAERFKVGRRQADRYYRPERRGCWRDGAQGQQARHLVFRRRSPSRGRRKTEPALRAGASPTRRRPSWPRRRWSPRRLPVGRRSRDGSRRRLPRRALAAGAAGRPEAQAVDDRRLRTDGPPSRRRARHTSADRRHRRPVHGAVRAAAGRREGRAHGPLRARRRRTWRSRTPSGGG